jgi:hypothetical protein
MPAAAAAAAPCHGSSLPTAHAMRIQVSAMRCIQALLFWPQLPTFRQRLDNIWLRLPNNALLQRLGHRSCYSSVRRSCSSSTASHPSKCKDLCYSCERGERLLQCNWRAVRHT